MIDFVKEFEQSCHQKKSSLSTLLLNLGSVVNCFSAAIKEKEEEEEEHENILDDVILEASKVKNYTFPTYAPPNVKDDMVNTPYFMELAS